VHCRGAEIKRKYLFKCHIIQEYRGKSISANALTIFNDVCDIQKLRRQDSWIHLEGLSEPGHLNY
jgi:hypothetical protein